MVISVPHRLAWRPVISRRRLHLVIALLLPLLALRTLVPAGYMVTAADGGLRIVICDAGFAGGNTPAHHHGDHHGHQHGGTDPQPSGGEHCPFAHAAVNAPPPLLVSGALVPLLQVTFTSRSSEQLPPATGPPRQTSARAPPLS